MKIETFALILSVFALSVSIVILYSGGIATTDTKEIVNPTDAQIMESRVYVSDYDNRVKNATSMITHVIELLINARD